MLVLTRRAGQSVVVGDDIRLTIVSVDKDSVCLGFDAPKYVKIFRSELIDETRAANRDALAAQPDALRQLRRK